MEGEVECDPHVACRGREGDGVGRKGGREGGREGGGVGRRGGGDRTIGAPTLFFTGRLNEDLRWPFPLLLVLILMLMLVVK